MPTNILPLEPEKAAARSRPAHPCPHPHGSWAGREREGKGTQIVTELTGLVLREKTLTSINSNLRHSKGLERASSGRNRVLNILDMKIIAVFCSFLNLI